MSKDKGSAARWEAIATRKIHKERELYRVNNLLLESVKLAYRKHHLGDESIGWEELSDSLLNSICEAIGDDKFQEWLQSTKEKT